MNKNIDVSVIIPAYNEEKNVKKGVLDGVYEYLKKQAYSFEIIFVDDGSIDHTVNLLEDFSSDKKEVRVIAAMHMGKGPTVARGMMEAVGESRLFTDFDQATPIQEIEKLLPFRKSGHDIVIGSREVQGAKREKEPFYRHLMGKGFNMIVKLLIIRGINDTQCGFKMMSGKATENLFPKLSVVRDAKTRNDAFTGAFDVELLFLARKYGHYKVAEVPVSWKHVHTDRVSPIKDSIRMFMEVVKIRLNSITGKYKK